MGLGLALLEPDGRIASHVHSHEESFYILDGHPVLYLDSHAVRLKPGACGVIPVGVAHAWRTDDGAARWIDMRAPRPRDPDQPTDTFVLGPTPDTPPGELDIRDPRNRNLFLLTDSDMNLDRLKTGAPLTAPTVSASMATAALAYSGITVKMLVDQRTDAQLSTMFMVDYQPGAVAHPHDHPYEEAYHILHGEIDVTADNHRYTLAPRRHLLDRRRLHPRLLRNQQPPRPLARNLSPRPPQPPQLPLPTRLGIPRTTTRGGRAASADRGWRPRYRFLRQAHRIASRDG